MTGCNKSSSEQETRRRAAQSEPAAGHADNAGEHQLVMRCMADIAPEKIEWLWAGRIAIGKQTLIGGEPGLGKSQITAALAATVTTGGAWPCDEGCAPRGSVLILSAEDDAGDTIRPRLDAAEADVGAVHLISAVRQSDGKGRRSFNLQADLALLEAAIERIGNVRLVIIDPVSSYLGRTDSHKNADVRGTLEPLGDMASRLRVAVVSITHFSKGAGQSAINSFIGSIAFVAAARAAFIVTRDPDNTDPARRLFVQAKNNLAADSGGLAFRVEQRIVGKDIVASAISWEGERIACTADEILSANREGSEKPERAEAEEFLRDALSSGPRPSTEIEAEARGAGVSWRTVRRAQKALGIKPYRKAEAGDGLGKSGRWYWSLPSSGDDPKMANFPYDGHVSDVATLGNSGHLRGAEATNEAALRAPPVRPARGFRHFTEPSASPYRLPRRAGLQDHGHVLRGRRENGSRSQDPRRTRAGMPRPATRRPYRGRGCGRTRGIAIRCPSANN
jgi:putative DNA primase/helicase